MGAINVRETSVADWGSRSIGTIWRAFDLQIATYAVLLTCFGLAMAYSNSVAGGDGALASGSVFLRGLREYPVHSESGRDGLQDADVDRFG